MKTMSRLLFVLITALAASVLVAAEAAADSAARIVKLVGSGSATVTISGQSREATQDMSLPRDAEIRTTAKEVYIEVVPGVVASVKANSVVRIDSLSTATPTLELKQGSIVSQIDKKQVAGKRYGVKVGNAVAAARGTAFSVSLTTNGTSITATADRVEYSSPSGSFTIQAGMISFTPAGSTNPGPAVPLSQALTTNPEVASTLADAVNTVATVVQNNLGQISADSATNIISQVVAVAAAVVPSQAAAFAATAVRAVTAPGSATEASAGLAAGAVTASAVKAAPEQAAQIAGEAAAAAPGQAGVITAAALQVAPSESHDAIIQQVATSTGRSTTEVQQNADASKSEGTSAVQTSNEATSNVVTQPNAGTPPPSEPPGTTNPPETPGTSIDPTIGVSTPN